MSRNAMLILACLILSMSVFGCSEAPKKSSTSVPTVATEQTKEALPQLVMPAVKWVEGTHFKVISDELSAQKEVVEYFSFWCPACYNFEKVVKAIESSLADGVSFKKVHVNFMGFTTKDIQEDATKALLIGRQLNNEALLIEAIFAHIHEQKNEIQGMATLKQLFLSNSVSEADFNAALNSDSLKRAFADNNEKIQKLKDNLNGVPNIIVNGKYQVTFTREMTINDIVELINWLSKQK